MSALAFSIKGHDPRELHFAVRCKDYFIQPTISGAVGTIRWNAVCVCNLLIWIREQWEGNPILLCPIPIVLC